MSLVLITTSNAAGGRSDALQRMLASVARTARRRPNMSIALLLLLQEGPADPALLDDFPRFVDAWSVPDRMSLSAARNILLARASNRGLIGSETIVGFPDDDCWYPQGTLDHVIDAFAQSPHLDLWFCRYASKPVVAGTSPARQARTSEVIRQASSNTMFVRGRIIQLGTLFDEGLGLGTPAGSAEDTEFALRSHLLSRQTTYVDGALVGHRDKNAAVRAKYYRGGLIAIARHARHRHRVTGDLCRKIGVGAWLTLTGELSFSNYRSALSEGAKAWRAPDITPGRRHNAGGTVTFVKNP